VILDSAAIVAIAIAMEEPGCLKILEKLDRAACGSPIFRVSLLVGALQPLERGGVGSPAMWTT